MTSYCTGAEVNLQQIKTWYCKSNQSTDMALHRNEIMFHFVILNTPSTG